MRLVRFSLLLAFSLLATVEAEDVVSVAILAKLFPLCSHGGRSLYEVVFSMQIVGIVCVVDLPNSLRL